MGVVERDTMIFDFVCPSGTRKRLVFSKPEKILAAHTYREVPDMLDDVEMCVKDGKYAAGYVAYEAAPGLDPNMKVKGDPGIPLLYFGIYGKPDDEPAMEVTHTRDDRPWHWSHSVSEAEYCNNILRIREQIEEGNTYQVNYTMRLFGHRTAGGPFDDLALYEQLRSAQQADYCAYLNLGHFRILSASPELFFDVDGGRIRTRPMKGTIKRGRWYEEDRELGEKLKASIKDRAENLMIVDLLRNDLAKIAKTGTVKVPELFTVEKYPTVYQMTSTITAEIREGVTTRELFQALFPCGSITGAPKISTMQIISELEDSSRGVYCGSIGYMTPAGQAVFNVAIRTVVVDSETGRAVYGVGGGVTWSSDKTGEYQEALVKTAVLQEKAFEFELLETMKCERRQIERLDRHLARMIRSAEYFGFACDEQKILDGLRRHTETLSADGVWIVRMLLDREGNVRFMSRPYVPLTGSQSGRLADEPVCRNDKFLFHKTTHRAMYDKHYKGPNDCFGILLWNEQNELTEFTIGNLVVKWNGRYYTPPVECGLLPGTLREALLEEGAVSERILMKDWLPEFEEVWLVNSLRGWVKIDMAR